MELLVAAILVGLPLAWLVAFAAYAYVDAPKHGMRPKRWAAIAFCVPLFGFFAYLFERAERDYDPEDDPYAQGATFEIHESRRGEELLDPGGNAGHDETTGDDADADTDSDEWNDPAGVDL